MKLFGTPRSRAVRCLWALEELGEPYEFHVLDFKNGEHLSPWFLELNPNGKVPAFVDGDLTLFESAAICTYLGEKFPKLGFVPSARRERALYDQWMFFIMSELEQPLWSIGKHKFALPKEYRIKEMKTTALYEWERALKVFAKGLANKSYLLGGEITMVDIVAGQTLQWARTFDVPIEISEVNNYRKRLIARPAFQAMVAKHIRQ